MKFETVNFYHDLLDLKGFFFPTENDFFPEVEIEVVSIFLSS